MLAMPAHTAVQYGGPHQQHLSCYPDAIINDQLNTKARASGGTEDTYTEQE